MAVPGAGVPGAGTFDGVPDSVPLFGATVEGGAAPPVGWASVTMQVLRSVMRKILAFINEGLPRLHARGA
jgi:hypothetical protein